MYMYLKCRPRGDVRGIIPGTLVLLPCAFVELMRSDPAVRGLSDEKRSAEAGPQSVSAEVMQSFE